MFDYIATRSKDMFYLLGILLESGQMIYKTDGTLELQMRNSHNNPWYYVRGDGDRLCVVYHQIISKIIQGVPIHCQNCWKVVVRPRTLKELFLLAEVQESCEHTCKCGTEPRNYVHGNYGGYFYFRSRNEGEEGFEDIKKMVSEKISPDVPIIFKRGCTEFGRLRRQSWLGDKGRPEGNRR